MLIGNFERIAEAIGRDERCACALAFDQCIGGKGGSVNDQRQIGRADAGLREDCRRTFQYRAFWCI